MNKNHFILETTIEVDGTVVIRYKLGNWTALIASKSPQASRWILSITSVLPKFIASQISDEATHQVTSINVDAPPSLTDALPMYKLLKNKEKAELAVYRIKHLQEQLEKQRALNPRPTAR